jgi:hypothetical protein
LIAVSQDGLSLGQDVLRTNHLYAEVIRKFVPKQSTAVVAKD